MKKHCSVLTLMIRSSFWPVLLVLAGMAALETGSFLFVLHRGPVEELFHLEWVVQHSGLQWIFAAAVIAVTLLLCRVGCNGSSFPAYTLNRLSVSDVAVYFWQAAANLLYFLLLWSVQLLLAFGFGRLYELLADPQFVTGQTVFLSFYRSPFFHTLLPFGDWLLWLNNLVMVLGFSLCAARYPMAQRRGRKFGEIFLVLLVFLMTMNHEIHDVPRCTFALITCIILSIFSLVKVFGLTEDPREVAEDA